LIAFACLFLLVAIAAVTDFRSRKIYNWTTYPGVLIALAINGVASVIDRGEQTSAEPTHHILGDIGIEESLLGLAACGGLMLVCYVLFGIGGGDVKLMAMMGAFLGLERGLEALLWTFVLAGCLGIIALGWQVGPGRLIARVFRQGLYMIRLGGWPELSTDERAYLNFPWFLAPTALAATCLVQLGLLR
jgi:prepilin peptidase CpaA